MSGNLQKIIDKIRQTCYLSKLKSKGYKVKPQNQVEKSDRPLNIVIPCVDKDAKLLPLVIYSIRKFLKHPINSINIVAPETSSFIKEICTKNNCIFVNEGDVLNRDVIKSSWYYQQYLKWAWAEYRPDYDYITFDADTIFLKDFSYDFQNKVVLKYEESHYKPYWNLIKSIGFNVETNLGFVCHHMFWKREWLAELKEKIQEKNKCSWQDAIKQYVDVNEMVKFSEFQTYGNFLIAYHKDDIVLEDWKNTTQKFKQKYDLTTPEKTLGLLTKTFKNNKSVTFPSWYKNNCQEINK